jgi:hypothetical protein
VEKSGAKLELVARGFADWRARKGTSDRVPAELWTSAVEAARVHGTTTTARRLRLNHSVLKRRVDGAGTGAGAGRAQRFVELPMSRVDAAAPSPSESCVEVEDGAGFRMRLLLRGATPLEVAAAARELWRARP